MREAISLSLPQGETSKIKFLSQKRGFASVSGYIQYLIELDKDLISEKELLNSIRQARQEYKSGKTITAKSLLELL